jgi:hypothetical protein
MLTMAQAIEVVGRALRPFAKKPGVKTLAALGVVRGGDRLMVRRVIDAELRGLGFEINAALLVIEGSSTVRSLAKVLVAKSTKLGAAGRNEDRGDRWRKMEHRPIVSPVFEDAGAGGGPGGIRWTGERLLSLHQGAGKIAGVIKQRGGRWMG